MKLTLYRKADVSYLPKPNYVQFVADDTIQHPDLTRTAFMVPLMPDGSVIMAMNRRRGIEFPGGHIDPGETSCAAAHRETVEETGYWVSHIKALGYLVQCSEGVKPADYHYPFPTSFQQFYTADVMSFEPYVENDECLSPIIVRPWEARKMLDDHRYAIYKAAILAIR